MLQKQKQEVTFPPRNQRPRLSLARTCKERAKRVEAAGSSLAPTMESDSEADEESEESKAKNDDKVSGIVQGFFFVMDNAFKLKWSFNLRKLASMGDLEE